MSAVEALLREARDAGVRLATEGERVRFEGTPSADLAARLREHKDAIFALLRREAESAPEHRPENGAPLSVLPPLDDGEVFGVFFTYADGAAAKVRPAPNRSIRTGDTHAPPAPWTGEALELVRWFESARAFAFLPGEPFALDGHRRIADPAKWYGSLEVDVAAGPKGPRATSLIEELQELKALVEGGSR